LALNSFLHPSPGLSPHRSGWENDEGRGDNLLIRFPRVGSLGIEPTLG
jgi:hypothetical protein